jgi:hypothetical protein
MAASSSDYGHVMRVAAVFVVAVVAVVGLRGWFLPPDFGVYGFFRAGALDDNWARPVVYAGRGTCVDCHADVVSARQGGRHEPIGCEACHGPLAAHASGEEAPASARPDPRTTCIRCHATRAGKPRGFAQVDAADHAPEGPCSGWGRHTGRPRNS